MSTNHRTHNTTLPATIAAKTVRVFGREVALWLALIAAGVKLASAFWLHLSDNQQTLVNAAAAAAAGLLVAVLVRDGIQAAVLGLAQAALALALGFGLHMPAEQQSVLLAFVTVGVGMFERTQVTAPTPATARKPLAG